MVLNTYAVSGPSGSARRPSTSGRSVGEGKAWVQTSSSSVTPMLRGADPATTGKSRPQAQPREPPPRGHPLLQVRDQVGGGDLVPAEVAVHQLLVLGLLDHRLDQ